LTETGTTGAYVATFTAQTASDAYSMNIVKAKYARTATTGSVLTA